MGWQGVIQDHGPDGPLWREAQFQVTVGQHQIEPFGTDVCLQGLHMIGHGIALRLPQLGGDIADIDLKSGGCLQSTGYVPHQQCVEIQARSDVLLLIDYETICLPHSSLRSKTFEYAGAARPVLALTRPGSLIDEFVHSTGIGLIAAPDDVNEIAQQLLRLYQGQYEVSRRNEQEIAKYTRRALTAQLAGILDSVAS